MSFRSTLRRVITLLIFLCLLPVSGAFALKAIEIPDGATDLVITELRSLNEGDAKSLVKQLNKYPSLKTCDLTSIAVPCNVAKILVTGCPDIRFRFTLNLYGGITLDNELTILNMDETLAQNKTPLSKRIKLNAFKVMLDCMPNLTDVTLFEATYTLDEIKKLQTEYPHITFHFTVRHRGMKFRIGATAYSTLKGRREPRYTAEDLSIVREYCPDLLALDVGHNDVYDLSFLSAWPNLKRLIVVDSKHPLTDLTPLTDLNDLEYVELFMQGITDISPLAGKTKLLDLNLCHNKITDLSPLYSCVNLERLWISYNKGLTEEEIAKFKEAVPGCEVMTDEYQSTGAGWRTHPRYFIMYDSFVSGVYQPFE